MAWMTTADMAAHVPLDVFDTNGARIDRKIIGFDPETGEVESFCLDADGCFLVGADGNSKRRREQYPAPLVWESIGKAESRRYWDQDGK